MASTTPECPDCKTVMKPLFGAHFFCPNDCDKPEVKAARAAKAEADRLADEKRRASLLDEYIKGVYTATFGSPNSFHKIDWSKLRISPPNSYYPYTPSNPGV